MTKGSDPLQLLALISYDTQIVHLFCLAVHAIALWIEAGALALSERFIAPPSTGTRRGLEIRVD